MEWTQVRHQTGFWGAEAVFRSGDWLLAKWNHPEYRGWQLYRFNRRRPAQWLMGAGGASLGWSIEEAQRWAEKVIEQPPQGPQDVKT